MKYAAWTKDREALKSASSGGIFYELAKHIVFVGGVVCGVRMDGIFPQYLMSSELKEIKTMRGSKYVWANPTFMYSLIANSMMKDLELDHPILFIGLPCQVIGLKRYLKNHKLNDANIFYVSLRCHGVIKTSIFRNYIRSLKKYVSVQDIIFRSKEHGWKGAGFGYSGHFYKPKLITDYIKRRNVATACKTCTKDRNDSDITLGDFWGCHPAYRNPEGTSVVELNTNKGKNLFLALTNKIHYDTVQEPVPVDANKIGLMKVADIKNFGNLMLSANFITYMKKINKDARFVFIENESAQDTVEAATGVTDIEYRQRETLRLKTLKTILFDAFLGLVSPKRMEQVRVFADCKSVAVLGGDHFSGSIHYLTWIINLIKLHALTKCGKSVHIVSNTVGKFPWFLRPFIKYVFNNLASIWCRDNDSVKRCCRLGVRKNVHLAPDLAFLPLHNGEKMKTILYGRGKNSYCIIVPSTLWSQYAINYQQYVNGVKKIADALRESTGLNVFVMPHSEYETDIQLARDICKGTWSNCFLPHTPSEARQILANSYLNVSFRMHGAISSLKEGVPVIAIAYSPKYEGVIADGFDSPDLVIDKMKRTDWDKCVEKTMYAIKHAVTHHRTLRLRIQAKNKDSLQEEICPLVYIAEEQE